MGEMREAEGLELVAGSLGLEGRKNSAVLAAAPRAAGDILRP